MKNRTDLILLAVVLVSIPLFVLLWLTDISALLIWTAVPVFCLQLLIHRRTEKLALRLIPLGVLAALDLFALWILNTFRGWDTLLGAIILFASIAPAMAIALAWCVGRVHKEKLHETK